MMKSLDKKISKLQEEVRRKKGRTYAQVGTPPRGNLHSNFGRELIFSTHGGVCGGYYKGAKGQNETSHARIGQQGCRSERSASWGQEGRRGLQEEEKPGQSAQRAEGGGKTGTISAEGRGR
ncbi:hypothetical protein M0804_013165 [Polistes exclamans]|nr:hypothetical protein M0804_013165 [Polistes exclamans]